MNKPSHFTFTSAIESQRELIHQWLSQDYIQEWVHGVGLQNLLNGLDIFIRHPDPKIKLSRTTAMTQHWIGYDNDIPFVYFLTSNVLKNNNDFYAAHCKTDGLAITLDMFIVDPDYIGKGIAANVIKEFLLSQFPDVTEVFIDPEKTNTRAVHVYEKAGFHKIDEFIASWHPVPHYLMKLEIHYASDS